MRLNQTIILTCQADGFPTPSFSWKFNGNVLNGVVQNTLALTNAEVKDAGNYTCVATNDFGGEESTSVVYFECKQFFTSSFDKGLGIGAVYCTVKIIHTMRHLTCR